MMSHLNTSHGAVEGVKNNLKMGRIKIIIVTSKLGRGGLINKSKICFSGKKRKSKAGKSK